MYLTPASIGYLTQLILAVVIAVFFVHRTLSRQHQDRPLHVVLLTVFLPPLPFLSCSSLWIHYRRRTGDSIWSIWRTQPPG